MNTISVNNLPYSFSAIYGWSNILLGLAFIALSLVFSFNRKQSFPLLVARQRYRLGITFLICGLCFLILSLIDFNKNHNTVLAVRCLLICATWFSLFSIFYFRKKNKPTAIPPSIQTEINERYLVEEKLITKNKQLEWTERTAKICYGNWGINKNEIIFSDGAENIMGIAAQQVLNFNALRMLIIPEDRIKLQRFIEAISDTKGITSLFFRIVTNGQLKYIQVNAEIYHDEKHGSLVRGTFQDVTEQQMFIKRIEDKNETLKQIAWMQSHDVRGPLATIMGLISIIDYDNIKGEHNHHIISGLKEATTALDGTIKKIVKKSESTELDPE